MRRSDSRIPRKLSFSFSESHRDADAVTYTHAVSHADTHPGAESYTDPKPFSDPGARLLISLSSDTRHGQVLDARCDGYLSGGCGSSRGQ